MQTLLLDPDSDHAPALERAVAILQSGGTLIFPTDTLYGLGCNALDPAAVGRVFDIKRRNYGHPLPMLVRDISWARELADITDQQERLITQFWPGKVTFILPRKPIVPGILCGGSSAVGIRAPDHPIVQELLRHLGYPLVGTSANLSGEEPLMDGHHIAEQFSTAVLRPDMMVNIGILPASPPSTIVDLTGSVPRITRQGAVRADAILRLL